jgi:septum formation protein
MPEPIILASASPQRKELLERIGFVVRDMPANIDESSLEDEPPESYVKRVARDKVLTVVNRIRANLYPSEGVEGNARPPAASSREGLRWVIGADTVVVASGRILGKPKDQDDALEMLNLLSGVEHQVITGYCVFDIVKNKEGLQAVTSAVRFKRATPTEMEAYLAAGESMDKAGSYAVQGVGSYLIEYVNGSYTNVVGLPLCQVVEMMQEMGARDVLPFTP